MSVNEHIPLCEHKAYDQPSVFTAANLLREARRQKGLAEGPVPAFCVLDPEGICWIICVPTTAPTSMKPGPAITPGCIRSSKMDGNGV